MSSNRTGSYVSGFGCRVQERQARSARSPWTLAEGVSLPRRPTRLARSGSVRAHVDVRSHERRDPREIFSLHRLSGRASTKKSPLPASYLREAPQRQETPAKVRTEAERKDRPKDAVLGVVPKGPISEIRLGEAGRHLPRKTQNPYGLLRLQTQSRHDATAPGWASSPVRGPPRRRCQPRRQGFPASPSRPRSAPDCGAGRCEPLPGPA